MLRMLVEIAGTEQMAAAGLDIVGLHLPRRFCRRRCEECEHTNCEKAYLFPTLHIRPCERARYFEGKTDWASRDRRIVPPFRLGSHLRRQVGSVLTQCSPGKRRPPVGATTRGFSHGLTLWSAT